MIATDRQRREETIYAIGDIHGCYDLLIDLLDRIIADITGPSSPENVVLVFLGDYVDRGPASMDVLAALLWIERHAPLPAIFLKGNHEQVMLDYIDDPTGHRDWLRLGGSDTLSSYGVEVPLDISSNRGEIELRDQFVDQLPASHFDFVRRLQLFHETEHHIFAHAGIRPGVPLRKQEVEDLLWIREGFLEERKPGPKRIVHGHTWVGNKPEVMRHRVGVDTGAYQTGVLTAAKLCGDMVDFISTSN